MRKISLSFMFLQSLYLHFQRICMFLELSSVRNQFPVFSGRVSAYPLRFRSTVRRPVRGHDLDSTRPRHQSTGPFRGCGLDDGPWWRPYSRGSSPPNKPLRPPLPSEDHEGLHGSGSQHQSRLDRFLISSSTASVVPCSRLEGNSGSDKKLPMDENKHTSITNPYEFDVKNLGS
uniref:Uncharacterized protein n=1 Tax=Solanum tuberosum TaxID=4113 RepID=M1DH14_SOLTU